MKKFILGILGCCVYLPMAIYLQYLILSRLQGTTDLMWFLFYFTIPLSLLIQFAARAMEDE